MGRCISRGLGRSCPQGYVLCISAEGITECRLEETWRGRSGCYKRGRRVLFLTYRSDHVSQRPFGRMRGVHLARVQRFTVAVRNILESKIFHVFNGNTA